MQTIAISLLIILALWSWCFYIRLGKMTKAIEKLNETIAGGIEFWQNSQTK